MRDEEMRFLYHILISHLSCSELLAKDFFVARDSISRKMTDLLGIFTLCHIKYESEKLELQKELKLVQMNVSENVMRPAAQFPKDLLSSVETYHPWIVLLSCHIPQFAERYFQRMEKKNCRTKMISTSAGLDYMRALLLHAFRLTGPCELLYFEEVIL